MGPRSVECRTRADATGASTTERRGLREPSLLKHPTHVRDEAQWTPFRASTGLCHVALVSWSALAVALYTSIAGEFRAFLHAFVSVDLRSLIFVSRWSSLMVYLIQHPLTQSAY